MSRKSTRERTDSSYSLRDNDDDDEDDQDQGSLDSDFISNDDEDDDKDYSGFRYAEEPDESEDTDEEKNYSRRGSGRLHRRGGRSTRSHARDKPSSPAVTGGILNRPKRMAAKKASSNLKEPPTMVFCPEEAVPMPPKTPPRSPRQGRLNKKRSRDDIERDKLELDAILDEATVNKRPKQCSRSTHPRVRANSRVAVH